MKRSGPTAVTHDGNFASAADQRIGLVDGKINAGWRPGMMLPVFRGPGPALRQCISRGRALGNRMNTLQPSHLDFVSGP